MKPSHLSKMCSTVLKSQLGYPLLMDEPQPSRSRQPKIRFAGNNALWFESDVSSNPAQLQIINYSSQSTAVDTQYRKRTTSELRLIPGQDKLSLNARLLDDLSQVVKGSDYTCRILLCPSDTSNYIDDGSLLAAEYASADFFSGLIHAADISFLCPIKEVPIRVQTSLIAQDSVLAWFLVTCMPCRAGQAKTLAASGLAWLCASCSLNQYVINPNIPSFGCKVHIFSCCHGNSQCLCLIERKPAGLSRRSYM
jgi:hypothetical protein